MELGMRTGLRTSCLACTSHYFAEVHLDFFMVWNRQRERERERDLTKHQKLARMSGNGVIG